MTPRPLVLSDAEALDLEAFRSVVDSGAAAELDPSTADRLDAAFETFSTRAFDDDVYGVNTGLGPLVTARVSRADLGRQQRNLLMSHASGVGPALSRRFARGVMLARARSMSLNRSAVRARLPRTLCALLNADVAPVIPRHGGVGASGDLVQLAHLGLLMIGVGEAIVGRDGEESRRSARDALGAADERPLDLQFRDGLAIVNGVSAMTGVGLCNVADAHRLLDVAEHIAALCAQIVAAGSEPFSEELSSVKAHSGQQAAAARLRAILDGGAALDRADDAGRPLQEHYSIRCAPQLLGAMRDAVDAAERALVDELNSVSDNPAFFPETGAIRHGGNFHGERVAMAMDGLKIAVVKCCMLMERQLNFLLHDDVNKMLPAFLNGGRPGVDFGFQGAQFVATSTTAHAQSLAFPMSVHSIPSNKDNQDIVSMGCDAALMAAEAIDGAQGVAAVTALAAARAAEIAGVSTDLSPASGNFVATYANEAGPALSADAPFGVAIEGAKRRLFDPALSRRD